jgi:hypothetical protein
MYVTATVTRYALDDAYSPPRDLLSKRREV